jgi:hypothetical protein
MESSIDAAEGLPVAGHSLALVRAVTLHEEQVGSETNHIVDASAGRIVVNEMLDRGPYGSVQVLVVYLELPTQQTAACVVFATMQLVCCLIELVQQPFVVCSNCSTVVTVSRAISNTVRSLYSSCS